MIRFFFFFKQKTAYEIRKGDWSSDVCSSDLVEAGGPRPLEVVRLTVARYRDEPRPGNVGADAPGDLVTVDARQADVDQRDVGPEAPRLVHAGVTVARLVDLVTEQVEQ